jgi:uncharacterized protein YjbJ (UPF0337 family)
MRLALGDRLARCLPINDQLEYPMNIDTLAGEGTEMKGRFKESLGTATADPALEQDGLADQLFRQIRQGFGALRDFARNQPIAAAAVLGAIGFALFRSRRGTPTG